VGAVRVCAREANVDCPVGTVSVLGVCGSLGVLSVGLFADGAYGAGWSLTTGRAGGVSGLFYGDPGQLGAQAIGAATLMIVMFGIAFAFFKIQNALTKGGIRPTAEVEEAGLDLPEMGVLAYPEFVGSHVDLTGNGGAPDPD